MQSESKKAKLDNVDKKIDEVDETAAADETKAEA